MMNKEFGGRFEIIDESGNVLRSEHNRFYSTFWKMWFDSLKNVSYNGVYINTYGEIPNIVTGHSYTESGRPAYYSPVVLVTSAGYARENSPEELAKDESLRYYAPAVNNVVDYGKSSDSTSQYKYCFIFHDEDFIDILSRNNIEDFSSSKPLKLPTIAIVRAIEERVSNTNIRRFVSPNGSQLTSEYNISARYVTIAMYYGTASNNKFLPIAQTDFVQPIRAAYSRNTMKNCHDDIKVRYIIEFGVRKPEEIRFVTTLRVPGDPSQLTVTDTTKEYSGELNTITIDNRFGPNLLTRLQTLDYSNGFSIKDYRDKSFLIKWATDTAEIVLNPNNAVNGKALYHDNNTNLQPFNIDSSEAILIDGVYRMHYVLSTTIGQNDYNIQLRLSIVIDNGDTIAIPSFRVSWDTL
jgi:hypothetical protein